jgi:hypothetical protein
MRTLSSRRNPQRGAVLIHVAIALLGLVAFSAFVVDYGIMWVSRGQAQTSADAGALSGAIALAFEGATDFDGAKQKARAIALANAVFGQAPDVDLGIGLLDGDVTFPECPPNTPGLPDTCVKVDVYRNQLRGNPLPMFFGHMVGVGEQGVRATATAQILTGDSTDCLKPWAVVDRWNEKTPAGVDEPWTPESTYDKYSDGKGNRPPFEPDVYLPPGGSNGDGTGFTLPEDEGRQFAVKTEGVNISSGWFMEIRLPRADGAWSGGNTYENNIKTCGGLTYSIAKPDVPCPTNIDQDTAAEWAAKGCFLVKTGGTVGPTRQGVEFLINKDLGATWSGGKITGSAFSPATNSPRVVPIGVMDIDDYLSRDPTGTNGIARLVNIYGFFIEGMGTGEYNGDGVIETSTNGKAVIGRLIKIPTTGTSTSPLPSTSAWLNQVILVR